MTVFSKPFGEVDESQLEGESWLSMRHRTEPLRQRKKAEIEDFAKYIAALPKENAELKAKVERLSEIIEDLPQPFYDLAKIELCEQATTPKQ